MKPDFAGLMPTLRADRRRSVLVAPTQFLADHLEILYDIDVGARQQAEAAGLRLARVESLNLSPRFIDALAAVVTRHIAALSPAVRPIGGPARVEARHRRAAIAAPGKNDRQSTDPDTA